MMQDPTPYFLMGLMLGVSLTLFIQFLANRKVKRALRDLAPRPAEQSAAEQQSIQIAHLYDRIQVLERLATDRPARIATEIDALR